MRKSYPTYTFAKYLWNRYRKLSIFGLFFMLVGALVDASTAVFVAPIFDLMMNDQGSTTGYTSITKGVLEFVNSIGFSKTTVVLLMLFLGMYLLRSCLAVITAWFDAKVRASLEKNVTVELFQSVVNANWNFFLTRNQGEFINSISRETINLRAAYIAFSTCLTAAFQIFTFGSVALIVSWKLTSICLIIAFTSAIPLLLISRLSYRWGRENVLVAGTSNSITQESFSLAKVIQAFAKQDYSIKRLEEQQEIQYGLNIKFHTLVKAIQEFYYPLGLISVISGYYFSRLFEIPFAELTIILYALWKCVPYVSSFLRHQGLLGQHLPSFENIINLERDALKNQVRQGGEPFENLKESIKLANVSFKYGTVNEYAIKSVSLEIKKGQMIALVGASGSGKSTLADIIMGFHTVNKGMVEIDGVDLNEIDLASFRKKIGYVPQQSALFNMTIRENLTWAYQEATDREILDICEKANALEFIEKLPNKLDTEVGDRGVRLSGGQVQRLAIARAILRKPEILILDEATSALDTESEELIQKSIDTIANETTLLVIAHRLSTIKNADLIYVLENGEIVQTGNYESLSENSGYFNKMVAKSGLK